MPAEHHTKVFGHRLKLYCRSGHHLTIKPNGVVIGSEDPNDKYGECRLSESQLSGDNLVNAISSVL